MDKKLAIVAGSVMIAVGLYIIIGWVGVILSWL